MGIDMGLVMIVSGSEVYTGTTVLP